MVNLNIYIVLFKVKYPNDFLLQRIKKLKIKKVYNKLK